MPTNRLLLASIHDVSPRFESEVDRLFDLLQPHVGRRLAMLVVPNHWGCSPIRIGTPFATRLRQWADEGIEMFLHGFYHRQDTRPRGASNMLRARFMTAGEGEFLSLSRTEAAHRVSRGATILEDVIGRSIDGFVAPAWLYGSGSLMALQDEGVSFAESHRQVWSPATGRILARGPVITWASRSRPRLLSSLAAASFLRRMPTNVLRLGVHPPDVEHPAIVRSIEKTLLIATKSRRPAAYAELTRDLKTSGGT